MTFNLTNRVLHANCIGQNMEMDVKTRWHTQKLVDQPFFCCCPELSFRLDARYLDLENRSICGWPICLSALLFVAFRFHWILIERRFFFRFRLRWFFTGLKMSPRRICTHHMLDKNTENAMLQTNKRVQLSRYSRPGSINQQFVEQFQQHSRISMNSRAYRRLQTFL